MKRDALVVGINQYPFLKDTPTSKAKHLTTPAADAEAIAQLLEADGNFRVRRLPASFIDGRLQIDPNKSLHAEELSEEIQKLFSIEEDRDTALLFFAGHGLQQLNSLGNKKKILLGTSDAKPKAGKGILLNDLWELLEESPVKEQIIWLDSCYSGELLELKNTHFPELVTGRRRLIIAASHSSEVAYAQLDDKHGVLSGALIEGLDPNKIPQGDWITDRTLTDFVEKELKTYYKLSKIPQTPQIRRPDQPIKLIRGQSQSNSQEQPEAKKTAERKVPFVVPDSDISNFTGRVEELKILEELLLNRQGSKVCSIAGLAGEGGIGKSALAHYFAELHREDFPDGVISLRVDGKDVNTIAREFARVLGKEIDAGDKRDAATIMQEVFAHRHTLLIFDNAEDASIRALRPGGNRCAVIVTTRDRGLPISLDIPDSGRINLPILSVADSLRFLQKLLGEECVTAEPEAAAQLIELSGQLPLALKIIGANLKLCEWRSLAEYAASLSAERRRLAKLRFRGDEHLDVRSCFLLSLKSLQPEEIDFFARLSVCAEDGFSLETARVVNNCDRDDAQESLSYLYKLSLVNRLGERTNRAEFHLKRPNRSVFGPNRSVSGPNRYVFHPLIRLFAQELAIERNLQDEARARHAQFFIESIKKSSQVNNPSTVSVLAEELKNIVLAGEWLQSQKRADYEFAICLSPFLQKCGYWQQAVDLMSGFQSLAEHHEDWNAIVVLCMQKSKYLSLLGAWSQAEEALQQIAHIPDKIHQFGIRQRFKAIWLNELGKVIQQQGRLDEAVGILQNSVLITEQLHNQRYLDISLNALRVVLQQQGRLENAVAALTMSVENAKQINSKNSLSVCFWVLGEVLKEQGKIDKAISVFQESIEITKKLGDQKQLLIRLDILGELLQQQERFDEMLELLQFTVKLAEQIDDQEELLNRLRVLARSLQERERFDEAFKVIEYSVEVAEKFHDQQILVKCLNSLAESLRKQGKIDEAIRVIQRSVELAKQVDNKQILLNSLNIYYQLLQHNQQFDTAMEKLQYAIEVAKELNNWKEVAILSGFFVKLLKKEGRLDDALAMLHNNIEISEQLNSKKPLIISLNNLGEFLQQQGCFDEAVSFIQRGVEIAEKLNLKSLLPSSLTNLGEALLQQGNINGAKKVFQQILETNEENDNREILVARLNTMGRMLQYQERYDEAVAILNYNLELAQELNNQQSLIMTLNNLGWILKQQQKWDEAENIFRRSQNICEDLNEVKNLLATVLHNLGTVLEKQQKFHEAEMILRRSYDLCMKLEDQRGQAMLLNSLGQLIQKQEGEDKFQIALMYFRTSIKLGEQLNDQRHLAKAHTAMGQALLKRKKINKAIEELRQGFEIDETLKNSFGLSKVTPQLTYALVKLGKRDEALTYWQRAIIVAPNNQDLLKLQNHFLRNPTH